MPTIITLQAIVIIFLLIKVFKQGIRINGHEDYDEQVQYELHPNINGDCCRCYECRKRYQSELLKDLHK